MFKFYATFVKNMPAHAAKPAWKQPHYRRNLFLKAMRQQAYWPTSSPVNFWMPYPSIDKANNLNASVFIYHGRPYLSGLPVAESWFNHSVIWCRNNWFNIQCYKWMKLRYRFWKKKVGPPARSLIYERSVAARLISRLLCFITRPRVAIPLQRNFCKALMAYYKPMAMRATPLCAPKMVCVMQGVGRMTDVNLMKP